jgi:uncharacterized protein
MISADTTDGTTAESISGKPRIQALDVFRGLAVLGVLAVNADGFAAPQIASLQPNMWFYPNAGATALSYWIMETFFHEKFLTIFSMLFGISLFLVGGDGSDSRRGRIVVRRLAILLAFGLLHGFAIWWGDILSLYAITGLVMIFCRAWPPKVLLGLGVALYATMAFSTIPSAAYPFASPSEKAGAISERVQDPAALKIQQSMVTQATVEAKSSWGGAYRWNTQEYLNLLYGNPWLVPQTLALMMIGLSLFKSGFLAGRSSFQRYLAVLVTGTVSLVMVGWLAWQVVMLERQVLGERGFMLLLAPLVSLAYVAGLVLLLKAGTGRLLSPLAAAGRMAFTNYLTQSLLMTSIFYGGRGGLMGEVDRPGLWAITICIWILQLIWSPLWLARFEMGPLEWVWRSLTLGRRVPLRKEA